MWTGTNLPQSHSLIDPLTFHTARRDKYVRVDDNDSFKHITWQRYFGLGDTYLAMLRKC